MTKALVNGRQVFCIGRSFHVSGDGLYGNNNPGSSRIETECDSLIPKGQGFLGHVSQLRVSWS
ncbi:MAG: hypothetical protein QT09_C0012G0084 [archaeon GW2011_AR18]|nr:MAG: hypothetical protein QT09_C0012G0084 [archaeon GW2011_AR18]